MIMGKIIGGEFNPFPTLRTFPTLLNTNNSCIYYEVTTYLCPNVYRTDSSDRREESVRGKSYEFICILNATCFTTCFTTCFCW